MTVAARSTVNGGWDRPGITEFGAEIVFRFQMAGVDMDLARSLKRISVHIGLVERMATEKISWPLVRQLLNAPGLKGGDDVRGLLVLTAARTPEREILAWARIGSLESAFRLASKNISVETASSFPLRHGALKDLLKMVQAAERHAIRQDDVGLWFTGGVLSLNSPYLNETQFGRWRRIAVHHIGMRRAAVACAAGLQPHEAVQQMRDGTFDDSTLRIMAGLRRGGLPAL